MSKHSNGKWFLLLWFLSPKVVFLLFFHVRLTPNRPTVCLCIAINIAICWAIRLQLVSRFLFLPRSRKKWVAWGRGCCGWKNIKQQIYVFTVHWSFEGCHSTTSFVLTNLRSKKRTSRDVGGPIGSKAMFSQQVKWNTSVICFTEEPISKKSNRNNIIQTMKNLLLKNFWWTITSVRWEPSHS